jgi:transcriptional regulator with XRE-family HTH domain
MDVQGIIANNLKTLRKSSGFTQQDVADLISTDISPRWSPGVSLEQRSG